MDTNFDFRIPDELKKRGIGFYIELLNPQTLKTIMEINEFTITGSELEKVLKQRDYLKLTWTFSQQYGETHIVPAESFVNLYALYRNPYGQTIQCIGQYAYNVDHIEWTQTLQDEPSKVIETGEVSFGEKGRKRAACSDYDSHGTKKDRREEYTVCRSQPYLSPRKNSLASLVFCLTKPTMTSICEIESAIMKINFGNLFGIFERFQIESEDSMH